MAITRDGDKIRVSMEYGVSEERLWQIITDTKLWSKWGPSVKTVVCESRHIHENSKGKIQTAVGLWVPFEITGFEKFHYWGWKVNGIEATEHYIEKLSDEKTRLSFSMPKWAAPYTFICWLALKRIKKLLNRKQDD